MAILDLSIIIPNFNGLKLFKQYFTHNVQLLNQCKSVTYEIIIADDNSTDESINYLTNLGLENLRVIINRNARGFGSNCNYAAGFAKGKSLFFLNSDVKLRELDLEKLLEKLGKENVFAVCPAIIQPLSANAVESITWLTFDSLNLIFHNENKANLNVKLDHKVLYCPGAALFCKTDMFNGLGGFDDVYSPFYVEDVDLCVKAWRHGWACYHLGDFLVEHYSNSTISQGNRTKIIKARNKILFLFKHFLDSNKKVSILIAFFRQFGSWQEALGVWFAIFRWTTYRRKALNFPLSVKEAIDLMKN